MAQQPHPTGSVANTQVREYIVGELRLLGLDPRIQETTAVGTRYNVAGRVSNVLVRLPGRRSSEPAVLLTAHYDGVPAGPAAADDASGCAVLLETLRALRFSQALEHDVIALFTDGEEAGLLGAAAFVREHPWAGDVAVVMSFESRGTSGPSLMFETGAGNLDAVRELRRVRGARATSLSTTVYRRLPQDTDLSELALLSRPAFNFAFIGGVERYHTAEDDVTHLDLRSVQHHGNHALALTRAFGDGPLPRPQTGDAVFFDAPFAGLVVYPEAGAALIAIVALVLIIGATFLTVRARDEGRGRLAAGITVASVGIVVVVLVGCVLGFAVAVLQDRIHASLPGRGVPYWSGLHALSVALFGLAIGALSYAMVRRWASAAAAELGALLAWGAISLAIAIFVPGASFLFTWPVTLVAAATLLTRIRAVQRHPRLVDGIRWTAAAGAILVVVPVVHLAVTAAFGLTPLGAAVLMVMSSMTALLLAWHLELLGGAPGSGTQWRRLRWTPAISAAAGLLLMLVGLVVVRTSSENPTGVALVYAVDSDRGQAWLTGYGSSASANAWLEEALRESVPAASASQMPSWLTRGFDSRRTVPAPVPDWVPAPSVEIVTDTSIGERRQVVVRIRPDRGIRVLTVGTDFEVLAAAVDGVPVDTRRFRSRRNWSFDYVAPRPEGFQLMLELRAGGSHTLGIQGRLDVIPRPGGFEVPRRPPGILPFQAGDMSLVYSRTQLPAR